MFRFTPRQIFSKVMVIGAGGTGGRLIPLLTQFLRSITREYNPAGWLETPTVYIVDDDIVEAKNLMRQNFIEPDIGKSKAAVLAQRYGRAYGINVIPILKRIESNDSINSIFNSAGLDRNDGTGIMYILCVDSVKARKDILKILKNIGGGDSNRSAFVIDAGNENNFGQVKFFNMSSMVFADNRVKEDFLKRPIPPMLPAVVDISCIPFPHNHYENLTETPSSTAVPVSCADLDQTLAINALMATTIMGIVQKFYFVKPFMFNEISISLEGDGFTTFNTLRNFRERAVLSSRTADKFPSNNSGVLDGSLIINGYLRENEKAIEAMKVTPETVVEVAENKSARRKKTTKDSSDLPVDIPELIVTPREIPTILLEPAPNQERM